MGIFGKKEYVDNQIPLKPILISTGNIQRGYDVIDAVFAVAFNEETWFKAANPSDSFEGVKEQLRNKCRVLGGDAVIYCQFEYRISVKPGVGVNKQVAEIWAYGTAVTYKD